MSYATGAAIALIVLIGSPAAAQDRVTFPTTDGGSVHADIYGSGERAVVLAHGGRFNKDTWSEQARPLAAAGFRVLALNFRGYGQSKGPGQHNRATAPFHLDILAAVRFLKTQGAKQVSVVGASMGGSAAADAVAAAKPGEIRNLVLLASDYVTAPDKLRVRTLFTVARNDPTSRGTLRLERIREHYARAPGPKELLILEGSAHAQALFATEEGPRLLKAIVEFLSPPSSGR